MPDGGEWREKLHGTATAASHTAGRHLTLALSAPRILHRLVHTEILGENEYLSTSPNNFVSNVDMFAIPFYVK